MNRIKLYGTTPTPLCVTCDIPPPKMGTEAMQKTAAQDAMTLFRALDDLLPYGTWKAFLQICKMESEQLG